MAIRKSWVVKKRGKVYLTKHGIRQCFLLINRLSLVRHVTEVLGDDCDAALYLIHDLAAQCAARDLRILGTHTGQKQTQRELDETHKIIALWLFGSACHRRVKHLLGRVIQEKSK